MHLYRRIGVTKALVIIFIFFSTELVAQFTNVAVAPINKAVAKDGGVAWADFNADGFLDLIVNTNNANATNGYTRIFISNGAATWTDITAANAPSLLLNITERSVMAADIDGDGDLDFMRSTSSRIEIYINNGPPANPTFSISQLIQAGFFSPSGMNNEGLAWMDFDGDGDLDVFMENHQYGMDILQNDGTGTFTHYTP
ncbi:MAG: VCBS repeat-containing protein, partial [Bacteroidetes bacterium]